MTTILRGAVRVWGMGAYKREYILTSLPFGVARHVFKANLYSALTGQGEQRGIIPNHARGLRKAMLDGTYTPTSVSVGLRAKQVKEVKYKDEGDERVATISLAKDECLPLTDGGHRFKALNDIREEAEKGAKEAKEESQKKIASDFLAMVDAQPIEAMVHLNGNTQEDFINLQAGKAVDAAHMLSLRIARKMTAEKDAASLGLAWKVAKLLHQNAAEPFTKQIRFDSKGMAPLPISTMCAKGASDLGVSLVGLAKIGLSQSEPKTAEWLSYVVIAAFAAIKADAPELVTDDKLLTPPPNGSRGSATMIIGVGIALAYRLIFNKTDAPTERDLGALVTAARETLSNEVNGNFSGPAKRTLLGEFVEAFFADLDVERHEGVPLGLLKILSASTYAVNPIPKVKKPAKAIVPDVDSPIDEVAATTAI